MKPPNVLAAAAILALCTSCTFGPCGPVFFWNWKQKPPTGIRYSGGDGSSRDQGVVIRGASHPLTVEAAEKAWAWNHNLFYDQNVNPPVRHSETNGVKRYDAMTIHTKGGKVKTIYFDVSDVLLK